MSQDPVVKALNTQRLRQSEEFQEAMHNAYQAVIQEWEHGKTVAERERAHSRLLALKSILQSLGAIESEGVVEAHKRGETFPNDAEPGQSQG